MIDLFSVLPKRHIDPRITRLYRRYGAKKVFTVTQAADALLIDYDKAFRLLMMGDNLQDSRFTVAWNNGALWLLPADPFRAAAKSWAETYDATFRSLPSSFGADDFSKSTGIPFAACNTLLSILLRYGYLHRAGGLDDSNAIYRLKPRRTIKVAA